MMNSYDVGDLVRILSAFRNSGGAAIDPDTVFFAFTDPAGTKVTYEYGADGELVRSGMGIYYVDVDAHLHGRWHYRVFSAGAGQAAHEGIFYVKRTAFP